MDHRLLIAGLGVRQVLTVLAERLSQAGNIAVAEDAENGRNQAACLAVALAILDLQILHQRLRHGQANRFL